MINISLVGCGNWALKIIDEINDSKNYNLISIVCRKNKTFKNKLNIFQNIEKLIESNITDCIYVAALPKINLEVIRLIENKNIPLIIEKPVSDSFKNIQEIKKILEKNKLIIYPNLTNYFSETFNEYKKLVENNFKEIKKIIIYEGNFGPFRKEIHPIWDWGFHSISLLYLLFWEKDFSVITKKEIKSRNKLQKRIVTKFMFQIDSKIKVKIVTGNIFKKKLRKMKIILNNNDCITNNMLSHEISYNNEILHKNKKTPISSLLEKFENSNFEISKKLIEVSSKTTEFLEKFYKC